MSESDGLAATPSLAAELVTGEIQLADQVFKFARQRWQAGVKLTLGGTVLMATGAFLGSQIPATPALRIEMAVLAALLCVGGVVCIIYAAGNLLGRLTVDAQGVRMDYPFEGFTCDWRALDRWEVKEHLPFAGAPAARFWTSREELPREVPGEWLTYADRSALRDALRKAAPQRETHSGPSIAFAAAAI